MDTQPQPASSLRRLVLTGFMGSGKTTVGRLVAARLGWRFADLDDSIEELLGLSVPRIFAEHGEPAFRAAELDALRELLAESRIVIALGGGALETPGLRDLLAGAPETSVVYLRGEFALLYQRCADQQRQGTGVERPLLGTLDDAQARYDRRQDMYAVVAHHTVAAHPGHPDEVADRVLTMLGLA